MITSPWICPRCETVHAPWKASCDCRPAPAVPEKTPEKPPQGAPAAPSPKAVDWDELLKKLEPTWPATPLAPAWPWPYQDGGWTCACGQRVYGMQVHQCGWTYPQIWCGLLEPSLSEGAVSDTPSVTVCSNAAPVH